MREGLGNEIAELTGVYKGLSHVVERDAHIVLSGNWTSRRPPTDWKPSPSRSTSN